ncbi:MAG TPA: bifunctional phosphoribosylaminoimidazolecarboxamide formyltransferase/IMP cyclohydrolase [Pyrinomonadaceae bacterium]|jgi:phosphoribosylaminoimidazolecarboxamide formyltransferase/IMP cyclohydrolase
MSGQNTEGLRPVHRALLSVSDKTGIVEFARGLQRFGVEIISTGGTARALREAGISVKDISEVTGFPEMMDGRVKTLHPRIHGGLLALRDRPEHLQAMREHGIEPIDMVVVNLYPFEETALREGVTLAEVVEQIDIGGPAMIRSAAKNWRDVAVIVSPDTYDQILDEMKLHQGALTLERRTQLAAQAFQRTSAYDTAVSIYLTANSSQEGAPSFSELVSMIGSNYTSMIPYARGSEEAFMSYILAIAADQITAQQRADIAAGTSTRAGQGTLPPSYEIRLRKAADLRYGENPHQMAALYDSDEKGGVAQAELLSGKEMSFNNYVDADAAWQLVSDFDETACAIIKHTNPAGVALGPSLEEAYRRALATDPVSAFGGIVAFNRAVDESAARALIGIFTEVVIAPDYESAALEVLRTKKSLRVLRVPGSTHAAGLEYKQITGGMLVQTRDSHRLAFNDLKVVTERVPSDKEVRALFFAWTVCKHVKSNAIVYAREGQTIGVGAGQMSRVDSVKIAAMRAQLPLDGSVLASDAFFPFRDGVDEAARHGITAVIQPGGSVRDEEVIAAADEHGLAMVLTGVRHFKH